MGRLPGLTLGYFQWGKEGDIRPVFLLDYNLPGRYVAEPAEDWTWRAAVPTIAVLDVDQR